MYSRAVEWICLSPLKLHGNTGKGNSLYLTPDRKLSYWITRRTCSLCYSGINKAKYYLSSVFFQSIIYQCVNSNPGISHIGQLIFTVRYIQYLPCDIFIVRYIWGFKIVMCFIKFIPTFSHGAKNHADIVLDVRIKNKILLTNCHSQSYDNTSIMSGLVNWLNSPSLYSKPMCWTQQTTVSIFFITDFDFVQRLLSFLSAIF